MESGEHLHSWETRGKMATEPQSRASCDFIASQAHFNALFSGIFLIEKFVGLSGKCSSIAMRNRSVRPTRPAGFLGKSRGKQRVGPAYQFGSVSGLQPSHHISHMNLHGALAHIELVGDELVGRALAQAFQDGQLPLSEHIRRTIVPCNLGLGLVGRSSQQEAAGRHESASDIDKLDRSDCDLQIEAHRYISLGPSL